jgi:predicted TIM-barrel fold metal-dependent hydrolase
VTGLVDHHCHSVTSAELDRAAFERYLSEARDTATGTSHFDSSLGFGVRRWCGPVLDLAPHVDADLYVARRRELGADEVNRRFLRAAGVTDLLVDWGHGPACPVDGPGLSDASGARVHDVLRLETLAEELASGCPPEEFPATFRSVLERRAHGSAALKSIVAYRHGLDFRPERPGDAEVVQATRHWAERAKAGRSARLSDPIILRFLLWTAADLGHRLQMHTGLGDADLRLDKSDPSLLRDFLEAIQPTGTTVLLLHCWPFHRHAAFLAAVYPHVYLDLGLTLNHVGPRASAVLAETLELAPVGKVLYASDAFGLAEVHYRGALRFRHAVSGLFGEWTEAGEISPQDADRIVDLVGAGNAQRVYGLPAPPA